MKRLLLLLGILALAGCSSGDTGWRSVCLESKTVHSAGHARTAVCARRMRVCMRSLCDGRAW